ncbi:MAG: serine/threonine-protein kinase [Bradymonadaceae bacterium]
MGTQSTKPGGETEPIDAPQSLVGRVVDGRYRLDESIDIGGMGIIFRAEQISTGRRVAVKVLKPSRADEVDLVQRFEREAEVLTRISHPNIVSLVDSGTDAGGLSYVALEFVDGATFRHVLKRGHLSLIEIVEVFAKTTSALAEAHAADVIHRDLKFDNVMVSRQADDHLCVTVLDFGVAKPMAEGGGLELTRKGQVPGTPSIVAPELVDEQPPTPQSDLYSLGVLLFTALTGEPPFEGDNDLELMRAHKQDDLPPVRDRVPRYVPDSLVSLTEGLLAKSPDHRPESARTVRRDLDAVRRELWELPIEGHPYAPNDPGPEEFQKYSSRADRTPVDGGDGSRDVPGWVQSFFDE